MPSPLVQMSLSGRWSLTRFFILLSRLYLLRLHEFTVSNHSLAHPVPLDNRQHRRAGPADVQDGQNSTSMRATSH